MFVLAVIVILFTINDMVVANFFLSVCQWCKLRFRLLVLQFLALAILSIGFAFLPFIPKQLLAGLDPILILRLRALLDGVSTMTTVETNCLTLVCRKASLEQQFALVEIPVQALVDWSW